MNDIKDNYTGWDSNKEESEYFCVYCKKHKNDYQIYKNLDEELVQTIRKNPALNRFFAKLQIHCNNGTILIECKQCHNAYHKLIQLLYDK